MEQTVSAPGLLALAVCVIGPAVILTCILIREHRMRMHIGGKPPPPPPPPHDDEGDCTN